MLFLILGGGLVVLGIVLIARVLVVHWKEIRLLDPHSVKEEQEKRKREELVVRRLRRVGSERLQPLRAATRLVQRGFDRTYAALEARAKRMEKLYSQATESTAEKALSHEDRVIDLVQEAKSCARDLKWAEAEGLYVEAIGIDRRNPEPYRGLAAMYLRQKLYDQAKETLQFLLKMKQADDATYAGLAEIAEVQGNLADAEAFRRQAITETPKNAARHAELGEFLMEHERAAEALPSFAQALELEPASTKYLELSLEAAILIGDRSVAQEFYDRLRFVTEDAARFRKWKAKLDEMTSSDGVASVQQAESVQSKPRTSRKKPSNAKSES